MPARVLLAALSAGAGLIHLVMVRSHADEWLVEGIAFAVVGVLQLAFAGLVLWRPGARLVRAACLGNVVLIGLWVLSRVWGLPVGPEHGVPHDASFVDVTAVVLEAVFVLTGYELLSRPDRRGTESEWIPAVLGTVAIFVATAAAVASPSASEHGHDHGGDGHDHGEAATAEGHSHGDAELAFLFPDGDDGGWSEVSNGMREHGNHAAAVPLDEMDPATRTKLEHQLALTLDVIERYPTVADAEAAGYHRTGEFNPGLGVHYSGGGGANMGGALTDDEISHPGSLIYDGSQPDSPIAGLMYLSASMSGDQPAGFAGPNDQWHDHQGICLEFTADGEMNALGNGEDPMTREQCEAEGAQYFDVTTSMVHVWTSPAYTNPVGVFAEANPALRCPDRTYHFSADCQTK